MQNSLIRLGKIAKFDSQWQRKNCEIYHQPHEKDPGSYYITKYYKILQLVAGEKKILKCIDRLREKIAKFLIASGKRLRNFRLLAGKY